MMMTLMYKISTSSESTGPRSTSASSPGSGESEQLDNKVRSQIRSSESYPNTRQNDVTSNIFITNSFCFSVGLHPSPTTPDLLIPQQMGAAPLIGLLMPPLLGCTCTCTTPPSLVEQHLTTGCTFGEAITATRGSSAFSLSNQEKKSK